MPNANANANAREADTPQRGLQIADRDLDCMRRFVEGIDTWAHQGNTARHSFLGGNPFPSLPPSVNMVTTSTESPKIRFALHLEEITSEQAGWKRAIIIVQRRLMAWSVTLAVGGAPLGF